MWIKERAIVASSRRHDNEICESYHNKTGKWMNSLLRFFQFGGRPVKDTCISAQSLAFLAHQEKHSETKNL